MFSKITKITRHVFFRNNVRFYILLFLLISSLLSAVFLAEFVRRHHHTQAVTSAFTEATSNLDTALTEALYNFMDVNLHHYIKPSTFDQFFSEDKMDNTFFAKIKISAIDSIRLNKHLKSLILYRESDQALLSTLSIRTDFHPDNPAYTYINMVLEKENPNQPGFVSTSDNEIFYYYPLYSQKFATERIGFAMAQLRSPKDFFHINVEQLHPNGTFLILNNNKICYAEGYNILSHSIIENDICISPPSAQFFTYHDAGISSYNFYCVPSKDSELLFIYYEPASTGIMALRQLFREDWIMPFLLICSTMFLFFLISIYLLAKAQHNAEQKEAPAPTLFLSHQDSTEALFPMAKYPCFSALLIEHHNTEADKAAILSIIYDICEKYLAGCQISYQLMIQSLHVHCYFNHSEYNNIRVISDSLKQILYHSIEGWQFNIYYTSPCPSAEEMVKEMQYLQYAFRYSQVFGYSKRFSSEWLKKCDNSTAIFDTNTVETMQKLLNEKKLEELVFYLEAQKQKVTDLFSPTVKEYYSYNTLYQFMDNAFFVLKGYFLEKSFSHPTIKLNMADAIQIYSGIESFTDFLIQGITEYKEAGQNSSSHEKAFMDAIYQYIEQNLATVTLNSMAEHFHITSAHLSRTFKRYNDQNFSEYLSEKKLQKAVLLLEQPSKVSINDIATELGYSTPSYFHTKFKEYYGVTPSAYRKSRLTSCKNP